MAHRTFGIVRFSVERRVTMLMSVLGVMVLGWLSLTRLPLEFLPSFSSDSISVSAPYNSSSPEEVERSILRPLEDSLGTINGIQRMTSSASANSANINLEFADGFDMDLAAVDVRDRVDRVRDSLPDDFERVYIRRFQSTDIPILRSSIAADWPQQDLFDFTENVLRPRLERLEGVAQVGIYGLLSRQLRVELIPARMAAHGVDVRDLALTLQSNNINISGGYVEEGSRRLLVRTVGEFENVEQIRNLPLGKQGLRVGDVADVRFDFPKKESYNYLNGTEALSLSINKASNANILAVVKRVKAEIEEIQKLPEAEGLVVRHFNDASKDVTQGLSELSKAGVVGGGLAVLFVFLFLRRVRTTALIAIAIPVSLVTTFVIIYLMRQADLTQMTLNVMSLMGLMLAVGMLFDNSIVVIESIFRHRLELGEEAKQAAVNGASAVAMPIIASTATTVCVFLPMIFVGGSGMFKRMGDVGLTVVVVMVASLLVSLTVVPMVAAILLRRERPTDHPILDRVVAGYGWIISFTLRHRFVFAIAIAFALWGSYRLYNGIARSYEPPAMGREIDMFVDAPKSYSVDEKKALYREVYDLLDSHRQEFDIADVVHRFATGSGRSRSRGYGGYNRFEIYLTPEEDANHTTEDIQASLREALPVKAGVTYKLGQAKRGPHGDSGGLNLELKGDDLQVLEILSEQIVDELEQIPMLKDIDTSLESGDEEIHVAVQRERALQAGLSTEAVARTINSALSERNLAYFKTEDREVGLVMQYREQDRETLDQLKKLPIFLDQAQVPVSSLAEFSVESGATSIEREDRRAKVTVTANIDSSMPSFAVTGQVARVLQGMELPQGYEWSFGRSFFDDQEDAKSAAFAMVMALFLIYIIMASLFENFVQPFTIMFSIPFAFIGVGIVMSLAGQPRSSAADMGLLILAGIVVNNAIVLIDHINQLRSQGMARNDAIILGGKHRLRPIVMTAVTTILGLSPMVAPFFLPEVFGRPEGRAAYWAPVGLVILGGLTTSTFLTLLVIPTIYSMMDDLTRFGRRVLARA